MIGVQLILVLLTRGQSAYFHGEEACSLSLDQRSPPVLKVNIIFRLEVIVDGRLLSSILGSEEMILGIDTISGICGLMTESKSLHSIDLWV